MDVVIHHLDFCHEQLQWTIGILLDFSKIEHNDVEFKANGFFKQFKSTDTYVIFKILISIFNTWRLLLSTILKGNHFTWNFPFKF